MLNAANRDPAYFTEPDSFNIRRGKNQHIAFGMGIHFRVGALLARTEAHVASRTIFDRLPKIVLDEARPDWDLEKPATRMLKRLPVRFRISYFNPT